MNTLVVVLAVVGCAVAAPPVRQAPARPQPAPAAPRPQSHSADAQAKILRLDQDVQYDGQFNYAYETENGISAQANGQLKPVGNEFGQAISGQFAFTAPDGTPIAITYVADEGGFRAEGAAIPTPPPVPEAIARALEYIRSLPPSKESQQF